MNVTEKYMLQQMQQMASSMTALPQTGGSRDSGEGGSFQDLIDKASEKAETGGETGEKQPVDKKDPQKVQKDKGETPVKDQKEELKAENVTAAPGAAVYMELFRPEITPVAEETPLAEAEVPVIAVEAAPEQETAIDLPVMDAAVETVELPETEETPQAAETSFQETLEEVPQETEQAPVDSRVETAEPERTQETGEVREELPEIEAEVRVEEDSEEPKAEALELEEPVFHDAKAAPVKVGETYETLDTQKPDADEKLADAIQRSALSGAQRIEIRLTPENLGTLTIEMTRDVTGALQVVLHASNGRAAGVLDQHLNGLHAALQNFSQEPVHIEVQRGEESQQQHLQQQADPNGHNQNRQQQEQREEHTDSGDFLQKMRLGLFGGEETL